MDELDRLRDENTRLRAALAVSKGACVYCQLPAEEMAKCRSGFPGCGRADDAMGCPELGAALQLEFAEHEMTMMIENFERQGEKNIAHVCRLLRSLLTGRPLVPPAPSDDR